MSWKDKAALTSGVISTGTLVHTGPALIMSVEVVSDGTNEAILTVHDNTAASGTVAAIARCKTPYESNCHPYPHGKYCENGIYATPSGTGTPQGAVNYIPL